MFPNEFIFKHALNIGSGDMKTGHAHILAKHHGATVYIDHLGKKANGGKWKDRNTLPEADLDNLCIMHVIS